MARHEYNATPHERTSYNPGIAEIAVLRLWIRRIHEHPEEPPELLPPQP